MAEDYYSTTPVGAARTGSPLRAMLLAGLISFLGGAGLIGWLVWNGRIEVPAARVPTQQIAGPAAAIALPGPAATQAASALDQHLAAIERRMAQLDLQAAAFDGNTARAEGLLVALAARRALEQGQPLGFLEGQLRTRFGAARPDAVSQLVAAAKVPVTLDQLAAQLDSLAPVLLGQASNETGWNRFTRELAGLAVIRHDSGKTRRPDQRLDQARLLLRSGQVPAAIADVALLPGRAAARDWAANAQRFADGQAALAQIEQAALTEPELLKGSDGEPVKQPGLSAAL